MFWLKAADGVRLRAAFWPASNDRGVVALFQGRTEFIEKFYEPVARLRALGLAVLTLDWRGQGLSDRLTPDRRLGFVRDFAEYQLDVDAALQALKARAPGAPLLLVSHSMGGAIAARMLMRAASGDGAVPPMSGAVFSAPMLGLYGAAGSGLTRAVAVAAAGLGAERAYVPGGSARSLAEGGFDGNVLTSDPDRFERAYAGFVRAHPELALGGASWGWVRAAVREMARLRPTGARRLVAVGDAERVVSAEAARRYARAAGGRLIDLVGGARHEPFLETDAIQEQLWSAIGAFVEETLPR